MTTFPSPQPQTPQSERNSKMNEEIKDDPILCPHCQRTANNGLKCKGICVADSDY